MVPPALCFINNRSVGPALMCSVQLWGSVNSVATQDEGEDEAVMCALCCQKRSIIAVCGECKEHYCAECIDAHTGGLMLFVRHMRSDMQ